MRAPLLRSLGSAALLGLSVCCSSPAGEPRLPFHAARGLDQEADTIALPPDWDRLGIWAFERWVLDAFPEDRVRAFDDASLTTLAAALGARDERAVRAAVLLARSADERSAAALIERLEQRELGVPRDADAADVVAAAGLGATRAGRAHAERLARLASGQDPHPDLEVRVECAASALAAGRTEVVPFLLRVLREQTPGGNDAATRDWAPQETMAWSKSRAAEALARAVAAPPAFSPDASAADQLAAADALAARLAAEFGPELGAEPASSEGDGGAAPAEGEAEPELDPAGDTGDAGDPGDPGDPGDTG